MSLNSHIGISELPGSKVLETAPTSANLVWTNNVPLGINRDWPEEKADEALMRTISPDRNGLSVPNNQSPDEFKTFALPSYGRADIILPDTPPVIDGVTYSVLTRKGIGAPQQPVIEQGEVFGTPKELNPEKYTAGFTSKTAFLSDVRHTGAWNKAHVRVRQPVRFFSLNRVFMTSGSEAIDDIKNKFPRAKEAGVAIWASRNPITFQDIVTFFTPDTEPIDMVKLKNIADNLLQIQALFLKNEDDINTRKLANIMSEGNGAGESEWFTWLSRGFGQQMMRKTTAGLVHGEYHRQNSSIGIEIKDLADEAGLPDEVQGQNKILGCWKNSKENNPNMASELIRENLFQLVYVIDLKIVFNVTNGRIWDNDLDELVNNYMQGMKAENAMDYPEISYMMYREFMKYPEKYRNKGNLYGFSSLCFINENDIKNKSLLPHTPLSSEAAIVRIFNSIRTNLEVERLDENIQDRFQLEYFELRYGSQDSEELLVVLEEYNKIIRDSQFLLKFFSIKDRRDIFTSDSDAWIRIGTKNLIESILTGYINNSFKYPSQKNLFFSVFLGESRLANFIIDIISCPEERRSEYLNQHFPESLKPIDLSGIYEYLKEFDD